jgi:hypothetical protein
MKLTSSEHRWALGIFEANTARTKKIIVDESNSGLGETCK